MPVECITFLYLTDNISLVVTFVEMSHTLDERYKSPKQIL